IARENLKKSQDCGKHYDDRRAVNRKFKPGNKVLVLLPTDHHKVLMQWKGPYEVETVVGINYYKVIRICFPFFRGGSWSGVHS
ncbi:hypothetical protein, partial [Acinetobacter baumannii]|uniref:hypothetical protein n=1 Tax=Acinetobacter baumannii TaxID=470 RepID=UPI00339ACF2F